ncbi:hypothetical protein COCSUDRAFT_83696 [Coccomyxa subellipsoidea C-169]|uniref:Uncharacterized protein n=1 Tax=Coccomyxa subellipsoidea (strain C-169) TaxID=574566 RepID=I0YZK2_COCSC|nr:hypothetical protein COCSUDRAFT_83696 [Coccomyxa subellipsoidea C-169]EIE23821.1 hypothetical protein COCSUDRAFT_83696 [Coccomyxa subellipsoidea C-169]|eukprot:XP_005648365.1 hypothetical protein COCSUDRAFT_83696 [Coccomyxa subellipsoidea C-169]
MANQRVAELFVETSLAQQPLTSNRIQVAEAAEPDATATNFDVVSVGSGAHVGGGRGLIWSINAEEPEVLSLLEFSNTEPVRDGALQLIFPSALSPHVAVDVSGSQSRVYANGSVLCIPQASLCAGTTEGASELKDAGGVGRLLTSLFARQASPAVKDLAAVSIGGRRLLAAAYADGTLRLWDLRRQACLLQEPLKPDSTTADALTPTRLRFAAPSATEARRPGKIIAQFDRPEAASRGQDSHFAVFELNGEVSTDGGSISGLTLQQVAILERFGAASAATSAADLSVHQRPGGRVRAWVLGHDGSAFAMDEAAVARGVRGAEAHLLGDDVSGLTSASEAHLQLQEDLWRSVTMKIEQSSGQPLPAGLPARHFVGQLLIPGGFSHRALHAALTAVGRPTALPDLTSRPVAELQQLTLKAVRERAADVGQFAAVHALLRGYWGALSAAQRPLGLLQGGPSAPSVVRGGPTLGLLRPAGAAAAHAAGLAVPGHPAPSQAFQWVALASAKLRDLLGPYVHSMASQLLAEGLPVGQAIMPALVHAIAVGPTRDASMGGARAGAQAHAAEVQRQWRRQRSRLALEIGALLEPIRSPEEVFASYAGLMSTTSLQQPSAPPASQAALPAAGFLAAVARDEAAAAADGARDLLLLLAYLGNVRSLGSFPSHSGQAQSSTAWQSRIAGKAEEAMRRAEIVRWLCTAPAAAKDAASSDPAVLMHQLRLGRDSRATALPPMHKVHDRTLAEALLPIFTLGLGARATPAGGPAAAGTEFASALLHAGLSESPEGAEEAGLKQQKQLPLLLPLLQLAGPTSDEPGLQFLKGYALLDGLRSVTDPAQRQRRLDEAAGPLFRAAADLAAPASDAGKESFVRGLLGGLAADLTGSYKPEGPEAERLQYYEVLMLVCERLGCPEGAARFAQAAVRQVDVAHPAAGNAVTDSSASARAVREGRLWSNLFVYSLDAGRFEAAYAAMHANPVPERQLDCLQRLLGDLCARGAIASLVALPFAGTLDVGGTSPPSSSGGPPYGGGRGAAILSLADEAASFLRRRADNAELGARPQPYQVLYDFCVARSDYRQAAAAQLALARRLRDEEPSAVEAVHAALSAALSALSLVEPAQAWLEDPTGADLALTHQAFHGSPLPNRFLHGTSSPRSPLPGSRNEDPLAAAAATAPALATPESLRRELALARAISLAAKYGSGTTGAADRPADVLQLLLANMHFEAAIRLAETIYSGAELGRWLERSVASLAAACVRLQQQEHQSLASASQATFLGAGTGKTTVLVA